MKRILAILIIALMTVSMVGAERITEDVEIRGTVATGNVDYDAATFAGFWYDLKKDLSSETLNVTMVGATRDANIVYQCTPKIQNYKNPALGNYTILGLFASKYVCYDDEDVTLAKTGKLVKLLVCQGGKKDHNLAMGELVTMPENFAVAVTQIDLGGDKAIVVLYKDGEVLDTEVCTAGDTYVYKDDEDVVIFSCRVEQVFRGTDTNMCTLDCLWLISDDILTIKTGDDFGVMEVTSTSGGITMESDDTINLGQDDEVDLMKGLYFKVADSATLRYYLAKKVVLECDECPVIEAAPCPVVEPEIVEVEVEVIKYVNVTVPAEPKDTVAETEAPGMEAVFAVAGLLGISYLILRQRD